MATKLTDVDTTQMVEDYQNGMGFTDIHKKYGVSRYSLRRFLVSEGVTIRSKGRPAGTKNLPEPVTETEEASFNPFVNVKR